MMQQEDGKKINPSPLHLKIKMIPKQRRAFKYLAHKNGFKFIDGKGEYKNRFEYPGDIGNAIIYQWTLPDRIETKIHFYPIQDENCLSPEAIINYLKDSITLRNSLTEKGYEISTLIEHECVGKSSYFHVSTYDNISITLESHIQVQDKKGLERIMKDMKKILGTKSKK